MPTNLHINLKIAGKSYPLNIDSSKEEKYRRAEKEISDLIAKFRANYPRREEQEYLAMSALQLSLRNVEMAMSRSLGEDKDALVEIDSELDKYLNSLK